MIYSFYSINKINLHIKNKFLICKNDMNRTYLSSNEEKPSIFLTVIFTNDRIDNGSIYIYRGDRHPLNTRMHSLLFLVSL